MDDTENLLEQPTTIDAQTTWTTPDGVSHATDANGNDYVTGYNPAYITDGSTPITIPNLNENGMGPGAGVGDSQFSLGNVAQGVNYLANLANQVTAAAPKLYNAIQTGKNAVTAINTPTATQQWITMPLQTKIILGAAIAAVLLFAFRGKL